MGLTSVMQQNRNVKNQHISVDFIVETNGVA